MSRAALPSTQVYTIIPSPTRDQRSAFEADPARRLTAAARSAIDPSVNAVAWVVRRLAAVSPRHPSEGSVNAARGILRLLIEQLHLPGRTIATVQVSHDPTREQRIEVFLGIGVLSSFDGVADEAASVARLVDAQLGRSGMPFDVQPSTFEAMSASMGNVSSSVLVRQRVVEIDDGQGGDVPVLMRFNPTIEPWVPVLGLISSHPNPIALRATVLPTETTVADRAELTASIRSAARLYSDLGEHVEMVAVTRRALTTLSDLASSFTSPVFCGELAIVSDSPISEHLARSLATCFTSDSEVLRRRERTVVAGQPLMLGGFDLEVDVPGVADALEAGVPLRGGLAERDLRDLWTLTEAPISWPVPVGEPVPGIPSWPHRVLPAPAEFIERTGEGGVVLGTDLEGRDVCVDDVTTRRHIAMWGRTGCGKTAAMIAMMRGDAERGRAFAYIDPHSAGASRVLESLHFAGQSPVLVSLSGEGASPICWAPRLASNGGNISEVETAARRLAGAATSQLPGDWVGPRFFHGAAAILTAACAYGCDITTAVEMSATEAGVTELCKHTSLPKWVRQYLHDLFARTNNDAVAVREWIVSKFATFFAGPAREMLAAPGVGVDLGQALLDDTPVIVDLAGLSEVDAKMVGHVVLSHIAAAIMDRGAIPHDAPPIRIYVDEAPRFHSHNLELLMTGGRKFGGSLVLAGQAPNQFSGVVGDQAMAAETQVVFAQTPGGARLLAGRVDMSPDELVSQPDFHAYVKVGRHPVFSVETPHYRDD